LPAQTINIGGTGSANARVHGHSFRARVTIEGTPSEDTGYIFHFDDLAAAMAEAHDALDHRLLNEVDGLAAPTLERIAPEADANSILEYISANSREVPYADICTATKAPVAILTQSAGRRATETIPKSSDQVPWPS